MMATAKRNVPGERKCVLSVGDDRLPLDRLRRRPNVSQMTFPGSGAERLAILADEPRHVVVWEFRVPETKGATLLASLRELHPTPAPMGGERGQDVRAGWGGAAASGTTDPGGRGLLAAS